MVYIPGAKNRASDVILRHPTGDMKLFKMQLLDDIFHITHLTPPPEHKISLQLLAGIHFENQHSWLRDYHQFREHLYSIDSVM